MFTSVITASTDQKGRWQPSWNQHQTFLIAGLGTIPPYTEVYQQVSSTTKTAHFSRKRGGGGSPSLKGWTVDEFCWCQNKHNKMLFSSTGSYSVNKSPQTHLTTLNSTVTVTATQRTKVLKMCTKEFLSALQKNITIHAMNEVTSYLSHWEHKT